MLFICLILKAGVESYVRRLLRVKKQLPSAKDKKGGFFRRPGAKQRERNAESFREARLAQAAFIHMGTQGCFLQIKSYRYRRKRRKSLKRHSLTKFAIMTVHNFLLV